MSFTKKVDDAITNRSNFDPVKWQEVGRNLTTPSFNNGEFIATGQANENGLTVIQGATQEEVFQFWLMVSEGGLAYHSRSPIKILPQTN